MARTLRAAVALGVGLYLGGSLVAVGQTLPTAKPEEVGLSSSRLARLTEVLKDNIAKGEIPGAVLLVGREGKVAYFESLGTARPDRLAGGPPPSDSRPWSACAGRARSGDGASLGGSAPHGRRAIVSRSPS